MTEPERAGLQQRFEEIVGIGIEQSRSLYKQGLRPASVKRYTDIFKELEKLFEATAKEVISSEEPNWINHELSANAANVETLNRHRNELRTEQLARLAALLRGEGGES